MPTNNEPTHPPPIAPVIAGVTSAIWLRFRDMTRDRQTDRQTSASFHDMATRSGPHNKYRLQLQSATQKRNLATA